MVIEVFEYAAVWRQHYANLLLAVLQHEWRGRVVRGKTRPLFQAGTVPTREVSRRTGV